MTGPAGSGITGSTRLVGVLGWPVAHSLSPVLQNAAFAALGLDWRYVPLPAPPARLAEAVRGLAALGFAGANVTIPHKERVAALVDRLDPDAALVGAVNTIVVEGPPDRPRLSGFSTDGPGFLASLREEAGCEVAGLSVLILGSGGSARALAAAIARAGAARVVVANRTPSRAVALVGAVAAGLTARGESGRLEAVALEAGALDQVLPSVDLIVQTTPVGMAGGPDPEGMPPVDLTRLQRQAIVADLVYAPRVTPLLAAAASRGLRTVGGLGMLLHQGVLSFERWTGRAAPVEAMRAALAGAVRPEPRQVRTGGDDPASRT